MVVSPEVLLSKNSMWAGDTSVFFSIFPSLLTCDGVHVVLIVHPATDSVVASWFACLACLCSVEGSYNASIDKEYQYKGLNVLVLYWGGIQ
jgi:hypothetical protein